MDSSPVAFWSGSFGNAYTARNHGEKLLSANVSFFATALGRTHGVASILELGCNRGMNLKAIRALDPYMELAGVDVNLGALAMLTKDMPDVDVTHASLVNYQAPEPYDLVFTKGVLIHVSPDDLAAAYAVMHRSARKYILIAEYFNPTPVEVEYRGHRGKLWKRDFAAEMLDRYPDLNLVRYGFVWSRDPHAPLDNVSWFLMEKRT